MGTTAENLHDRFPQLTKERADAFAAASQDKLRQGATPTARSSPDLVPVATRSAEHGLGPGRPPTSRRGPGTTVEALAALRTPFRPHGRVTAGNAAGLNDGATACLLAAADVAAELGLPVADAAGRLRLRRRRPGGHGRRPDPGDREGAAPRPV